MNNKLFLEKINSPEFGSDIFISNERSRNEQIVAKYLEKWSSYRNGKMEDQEKALQKLFELFPDNSSLEGVLLKASCLNSFYSTNIKDIHAVGKVIFDLQIDSRLNSNDLSLVDDIAENTKLKCESGRREFSFASKYCSFHKPESYPIYDSRNKALLNYYSDELSLNRRKLDSNYSEYTKIINKYKKEFALEKFSFKEIDRFNWLFVNTILGL